MALKKKFFPKVSIVIPAYNASKVIKECLQAIQKQTILIEEVIVVNDYSTDNTKEISQSFRKVKVINLEENKGPAHARNKGAEEAKGDIIIFLDSDCIPNSNWAEEMIKPFEDEQIAGVQGAYRTKQHSFVAQFEQMFIGYTG